jgi:hypothetical protein
MPGFDGTGPAGMGPMTGGGRGFCSPWDVNARQYFPHRLGYAFPFYRPWGYRPSVPWFGQEGELEYLRDQTEMLKRSLEEVDARIKQLTKEGK